MSWHKIQTLNSELELFQSVVIFESLSGCHVLFVVANVSHDLPWTDTQVTLQEGCSVTPGGAYIIPSAPLKSSVPLGAIRGLELVPVKWVWFSSHLISARPEIKP